MTEKAGSIDLFVDKIRDVSENFREEFLLGETSTEYVNTGPPPNMKRRRLIFDSVRTIIERDAGKNAGGRGDEDRGRYVYVFGAGYHGQLGRKAARGHKKYANIPIPVSLNEPVRQIACGALHTAVVTDDGKVFTWGDGRMGQLGHLQEGFSNQPVPTVIHNLISTSIVHVACGQNHTIAVADTGEVYAWGWAKYGQLGLGSRTNQRYPAQIKCDNKDFVNIKQVSCGDRHTVVITKAGMVFSFGSGEHGQLGHGDNHDQYSPKQIGRLKDTKIVQTSCGAIHTAAVTEDGELYMWGFGENLYGKNKRNFNYEPLHIPFKHKISQVACGQSHVLILTENTGDVYGWGDGIYGEIGQGAFKASQQPRLVLHGKNISSISVGRYHSSAVSNIGALYTWGCGDNGQLGRLQERQDNYSKRENSVPKLVVPLVGNVVGEISCGEHHTCVLASCRYKTLSDDVMEWGKLEEMEFQAKLNIVSSSKQKGRGICKKDLTRIRKWRREEEARRTKKHMLDQSLENKKIEEEVSRIAQSGNLRETVKENIKKSPKKQPHDAKEKALPPVKGSRPKKKPAANNASLQRALSTASMEFDGPNFNGRRVKRSASGSELRVTAKQANNLRSAFHETGRSFLTQMASQIYGIQNPDGKISEQQNFMLKNKFAQRKEFDRLKLIGQQREQKLRILDEELAMLQEADDCSEVASQAAEMQLRKLGMKLNTVMIKISEAERSRRTYELNIAHIKDESQENHKQLDALRRNLFHQENLRKKIAKFRDYATHQRELAQLGLKEFLSEIDDWRNFLNYSYRHFASLAKSQKEKENDEPLNMLKQSQAKKQQKAMHRIVKLQRLVETNDKEISRLSEKRNDLEDEIEFYEMRFHRIHSATGLTDPEKIINKFFVNEEIHKEQHKILASLNEERDEKLRIQFELDEKLKKLSSERIDHTWREVDSLQEQLQAANAAFSQHKDQGDKLNTKLTQLREWMYAVLSRVHDSLSCFDLSDRLPHTLTTKEDPLEVLELLRVYIFTLQAVMQDLRDGEGKFKRIERQEVDNEALQGQRRKKETKISKKTKKRRQTKKF